MGIYNNANTQEEGWTQMFIFSFFTMVIKNLTVQKLEVKKLSLL